MTGSQVDPPAQKGTRMRDRHHKFETAEDELHRDLEEGLIDRREFTERLRDIRDAEREAEEHAHEVGQW